MKKVLYRNINTAEFLQMMEGYVTPLFSQENRDSTYAEELGKVTCWFDEPITMPTEYDFLIKVELNESNILGSGEAIYRMSDTYDQEIVHKAVRKEYYTKGYSLQDVKEVQYLSGFDCAFLDLLDSMHSYFSDSVRVPSMSYEDALNLVKRIPEVMALEWFWDLYSNSNSDAESLKKMAVFLMNPQNLEYVLHLKEASYRAVVC